VVDAIDEDVQFDHAGAQRLIKELEAMAEEIFAQRPARRAAVSAAMVDFKGPVADAFANRHHAGAVDGTELELALRDAADNVRAMIRAADAEQGRREAARAWQLAHDENQRGESWFNRNIRDKVLGEDAPPPPKPPPAAPEPRLVAPPGRSSGRGS
jgi:hypothetical protein